ncbi:MAG TPA: VCBS repeat-containing protein [Roseiflexaceae bacterium]|nr:VCBS repeat-containing protein [Roseiflexaceae bacterium]
MSSLQRRAAHEYSLRRAASVLVGTLSIIAALAGVLAIPASAQQPTAAIATSCLQSGSNLDAGYTPFSLALGDLNSDGKVDLVIANRELGSVSVALGNGLGSFQPRVSFNVGYQPYLVALGDVNGDGKLDLATANFGSNDVSVLLGNGAGNFSAAGSHTVGLSPRAVAVRDVSGDGKPDLVVANMGGSSVSVLFGTGTGSFNAAVQYTVAGHPQILAIDDLNGDGRVDLVVPSDAGISVLLGTGSGTFGAATNYPVTTLGYGSNFALLRDLNDDGFLDAVATTGGGNTVSVLLGTGTGGFGPPVTYPVGSNPVSVAFGDLNSDTIPDLAVANWYSNSVSLLYGNGDGTYQAATDYIAGGGQVNSVTLGDLNADSRLDLLVANYTYSTVTVMLGQAADLSPPTGSITINQGAAVTASPNVTLNIGAQDVGCGVASMAFSNDGVSFGTFEPYASTKAWTLQAGDGLKTVYAMFKDRAHNTSPIVSTAIVLDQLAPTGGVQINSGAMYTTNRNVGLSLAASDVGTGVRYMALFDGLTSSGWISYTASAGWLLAGADGIKTVTARFRDLAGNISDPSTDTIVLDTLAPSVTMSPLSSYQFSPTFSVGLSGSDATSGISNYDVQFRDGANGAWTGWLTATTATSTSFSGQDGHTYSFRARAHDNAGNTSAFTSGNSTTTVDATPPLVERFLINSGALQTTGIAVSLSVGASDPASGVDAMSFSNDGTSWSAWQPYATIAIWSLPAGDGVKTVYGRFRDAAGNTSALASDSIVLNTFVDTEYGLTINNGALFTNQISVTLSIGAPLGTTQLQVSNDGGFSGSAWEPYTGSKAWQISQYGTYVLPRIVYLRYKDQNGIVSGVYQDDIILDVLPPLGRVRILPSGGTQSLASAGVMLQLSASDDVSGVAGMRLSNQPGFEGVSWQPYATSLAWDMPGASVYVQFRDHAGNISQTYVASQERPIYVPGIWR